MATLAKEYDVIVVGGGINGLTTAAYLQKSGLKVAVFERGAECGTQCCSEELLHPGVKVNLCANAMYNLNSPCYDELELERFGLEMVSPSEWAHFYPIRRDKSAVLRHSYDARKTYEAWKGINEHDAETYRKLVNYFSPMTHDLVADTLYTTTQQTTEGAMLAGAKLVEAMAACPLLPKDVAKMSTAELADELWQDERIKADMFAMNLVFDTNPLRPGFAPYCLWTGQLTTHLIYQAATARGGPHALTHALARCFVHYGGSIFTDCPVDKIIVENGEAKGVVLSKNAVYSEAEVRATKAVASDLSPTPTFRDLVGLDKLAPEHAAAMRKYSYDGVILFTAYFALSEPMDWSGAGFPKECDRAYGFNFGVDDAIKDIKRADADWKAHRLPDPPIVCGLSVQGHTLADPTQAPAGQHTVMTWTNVTYDLSEYPGGAQAWDDIRENYGNKIEDLLATYVPNLKKAKLGRYDETPLGYYRRNPSQIKGHWFAEKKESQFGLNAPFPGCGAPRTPIENLYIIRYWGTSTYLDAGYRAADIMGQDLGIREQEWWHVKPFEALQGWFKRHGIKPRPTVD